MVILTDIINIREGMGEGRNLFEEWEKIFDDFLRKEK